MAQIVARPQRPPTTINQFLGLNEDLSGDTQLKVGESPRMLNFRITDNLKLEKREGYTQLFASLGTLDIQGMWYGRVGGAYHFLFAAGGHIYKHNLATGVNTIVGSLTDAPTSFFAFGENVYLLNGYEYLSWNGTGTFASVSGYVPLIATATPPTGGGSDNEGLNVLTGKKRQLFSSDGTTAVYVLRESNIDSVDSVKVNGVVKTAGTHYTVNIVNGSITFTAGNIPSVGIDDVEIAWTKGNGSRSEVTGHKFAMFYGGQNDTRVFIYGDGSNKYYYTGLANGVPSAEYFPALNFNQVGSDEFAVTDIVRQYDRQIIFTNGQESYYSYYDTLTDVAGNVIPSFPTFPLNDAIGNVAFGQSQLVQNNPYSIQNGIYEFVSTNVRDERNANLISKRVQPSLMEKDLALALTIDWEAKREYWLAIGTTVWVHNYLVDAWYKYTLAHEVTCLKVIEDEMYFGTSDGRIMKFESFRLSDNGAAINGIWESGFYDFGTEYMLKYLDKIWLSLFPGPNRSVNLTWQTDKTISSENEPINVTYELFTFEDVKFDDFTFNTEYNPQPFLIKTKAKKFVYFKVRLTNDSANSSATILSINLQTRTGGESK